MLCCIVRAGAHELRRCGRVHIRSQGERGLRVLWGTLAELRLVIAEKQLVLLEHGVLKKTALKKTALYESGPKPQDQISMLKSWARNFLVMKIRMWHPVRAIRVCITLSLLFAFLASPQLLGVGLTVFGHKVSVRHVNFGSREQCPVWEHVLAGNLASNPAVAILTPDLEELTQHFCAVLDLQVTACMLWDYSRSKGPCRLCWYCDKVLLGFFFMTSSMISVGTSWPQMCHLPCAGYDTSVPSMPKQLRIIRSFMLNAPSHDHTTSSFAHSWRGSSSSLRVHHHDRTWHFPPEAMGCRHPPEQPPRPGLAPWTLSKIP